MGHLVYKDAYRALGASLDGLTVRVPWTDALRQILEQLYTPEEAALVSRMPTGLASVRRVSEVTGMTVDALLPRLDQLAAKGLVMDLAVGSETRYTISPMVIGIFEFTMMRTDREPDFPRLARLFHEYMTSAGGMHEANFSRGERVSFMRTLPHEGAVSEQAHVQVLDHQRASALVEEAAGVTLGTCSCRHEKHHLGVKACDDPLESCISFGTADDYMVRRGMARVIDRAEARDVLARARESGCVFNADNVRTGVSFLCLCCSCCCNVLSGIRSFGLPNIVVSSGFVARCAVDACTGCGKCAAACPITAITMVETGSPGGRRRPRPRVDESYCIGCGVCTLKCSPRALRLEPSAKRPLLPEDTVERVILQALERGTLQNFIVDNPNTGSSRFLRAVLAVFLGLPPVKRAMMSDVFRSRFLSRMAAAASGS